MNQHNERPGFGVMYYEEPANRKSEKAPDFKGYLILEMDYKAGEKLKLACWERKTSRGYNLLSLAEDNFSKKKQMEREDEANTPKEVKPAYRRNVVDDNDVPF
jgi:hypothetical protein